MTAHEAASFTVRPFQPGDEAAVLELLPAAFGTWPRALEGVDLAGFFRWSHGSFPDGSEGYSPTVKDHAPYAGEEWRIYPELPGHPQQKDNLREFASRFYFQWFYD